MIRIFFIAAFLACAALTMVSCSDSENDKYIPVSSNEPPAVKTFYAKFEGPGGHSNGAYGRVNAVHAAARALKALKASASGTAYTVTDFSGGNSVNSIAASGEFTVTVKGSASDAANFEKLLRESVERGTAEENAFRGVTAGAADSNGGRIDVRSSVSEI